MLLNRDEISSLIESFDMVEKHRPEALNSASLDVHLGRFILVESLPDKTRETGMPVIVSLRDREPLHMTKIDLQETGCFRLRPGQFILAETQEKFNLPLNVSAEYKLKSSMARIGLEHLNAGWCDAGWTGSVLTLEFRNLTTFHEIELVYGDAIGQIVFFKHNPVALSDSYKVKGRYNGLNEVSGPICNPEKGDQE